MTGLLEFREKLKLFYSKNEFLILPLIKFLLALMVLNTVNGQLGYMTQLDNIAVVLIVALLCSFLPMGSIALFAFLFSLAHMYALSLEVAAVGFCVYLLMFLLFLRFSHKEALVVVITPILCVLQVPYIMPVAMGLLGTPASAVSVACGVIVYYLFMTVSGSASTINTMGDEEATAKLRLIIDGILNNREMLVMVAAFAITVIVVYLLRRMAVDHCWTIAMIAGAMTNLVILLLGDLMYNTKLSVLNAVLGTAAAIAAAKIIEFFRFCVDYSRTEKVQFEDDEYYYYVKAVPKMTVTAPTKTVKRINTQRRPASAGRSTGEGTRAGAASAARSGVGQRTRNVTTERITSGQIRTGRNGRYDQRRSQGTGAARRNDPINSGRSVTINSNMTDENGDDYEELF